MKTQKTNRLETGLLQKLLVVVPAQLMLMLLTAGMLYAQDEQAVKTTFLSSKAPSLRFEHIGLEEGMAQASANSIMQDSKGFLWITTQGGLHRYDGHEFKVYAETPFDTTSISDSWVWGAAESKTGDIWVTTEGKGLNRLNQSTGEFKKYFHDPDDSTSLSSDRTFFPFEDSRGDLWVGTFNNGINRMRAGEDGVFTQFTHVHDDQKTISSHTIYWITEDAKGNIWAGSGNGVSRINPETDEITRFLFDAEGNEFYGSPHNVLGQYHPEGRQDIIWLATGNGLVRLNSETGGYKRFLIAPNESENTNPLNFIHQVVPDPDNPNVLWVGGPGTGVARFDMQAGEFTSYRKDPRDPNSLSDNFVQSMFTDRSGTIWVGTATEGLEAFNPGAVNFTHLRNDPEDDQSIAPGIVWGVYEDKEGTLWVGSDVGAAGHYLSQFDTQSGMISRYKHDAEDPSTLLFGSLRVFAEDGDENFWVGGSGGLNLFDPTTGKATRFRHPQAEENRGRNNIFALLPTAENDTILWVGSAGGLDLFKTHSRTFEHVLLAIKDMDEEPVVLSLHQDANHVLWAGTTQGLIRLDTGGNVSIASAYHPEDTTSINHNQIVSIAERKEEPGILWLATQNGGLNRFDSQTGKVKHYNKKEGIPSNTLYGLLEDKKGTLWMSTNNGISNFDPVSNSFRNYGLDDGLMALEYSQNAYFKGREGVLYFGSGKGVTAFVPELLHINEIPPQVVLSDFKIFNASVPVGPDSPLKKPLSENPSVTLAHNQNEITFDYVALHFANSAKNKYLYRLQGFDSDWIEAGTKRSATYTNLPYGDYTFNVKASNADGIWNEKGASLRLSILPPWYRTWWAYGLFLGVFCTGIFGVDRVQRRRLSKKEQERTALREAELRAEAENKRRADTEQLSKIGRAITSTLSVDKIIETVYENVNNLMDAAIFGVGIYDEQKNHLDFPATKEDGEMLPPYINHLDDNNWLSVWCFKNSKEIVIGDFNSEHAQYVKEYEAPLVGKVPHSVIYLPLVQQDRTIGVITTQSFKKDAYSPYHVNLLRNLATYAAIALDNAAAYRQLNATLRELQAMQQQLVQQEKLASLGQLTAGIAHEIKNPLNFVNNFSDLSVELIEEAKEEVMNSDHNSHASTVLAILNDIELNLQKIHEHGNRADRIVRSMLQHSRGGGGTKQSSDLNTLIEEYLNLSFHGMRAGPNPINVDFKLELDKDIAEADVNPEEMSRVFINLFNNAFDAMREKAKGKRETAEEYLPELMVRTKAEGNTITIEIEDNGPGIPEEIKDKILQPFFTTKKGTEGTGLGLSISSDIIKAHGGTLDIESQIGNFTKFIINIPT
ncbi:MAG TPA: two-component regulator propeller domain-containing protein [Halalkalibaculum sp.]|nr:two-component regulator propeller domain-containing protein [Halalkalibaculum sp.]